LTPSHFRRMFRMKEESFNLLCKKLMERVGVEKFQPEEPDNTAPNRTIPPICGEVKVAVALRILAGGSYLDLIPLFDVSKSHLYKSFHDFIDWVLLVFEFPLPRWLRERNWEPLIERANHFAEKSDGIFYGPFAANDGIAIKIRSPSLTEVSDPGNYYCRKGFYSLNVQAICDRSKRFLWTSPSNKGSTHDSVAFTGSRLYDLLEECSDELYNLRLFIAGDTAYGMTPFMIVPYDMSEMKQDPLQAKDSFNYHLSSCRIYIECAFGELVMRWGIFWRTLLFELKKCTRIIQAAMLLHNFIIDFDRPDITYFSDFSIPNDATQANLTRKTGEIPRPMVTDNNEPRTAGRISNRDHENRKIGAEIRRRLTVKLSTHDLRRPLMHDMKYNSFGHVYMTS
jgi:DDE superfamily endonuclease